MGLSFAIPINEAIKVKDDIVKTGHVSRGRLGVAVQSMNQTLANSFGMQKPQGALVAEPQQSGGSAVPRAESMEIRPSTPSAS